MSFEFRTSQELRKKAPALTLVEENGTERTLTNLKENGTPPLKKWWNTSKKLDTQYSEVSVR